MSIRTILLSAASALALVAASPFISYGHAAYAHARSSSFLEGSWRVTTTPYNCATGELLTFAAFEEYMTFGAEGTLTETTANPAFEPGQRSPGHGFWERTGPRTYRAVFQAFIEFTSVGTTPPRYVRGSQRADHGVDVIDANHWQSSAAVSFFDPSGTLLAGGCAASAGVRIE
jgi:hypothetical protein